MGNIYTVNEINLRSNVRGADFALGNSLLSAVKKHHILDMVFDLMLVEAFLYLMVVGFL